MAANNRICAGVVDTPTISVIIPVYNGAHTIVRALDSVLEQTYPACEIIVVDDGSTDNIQSVVKSYADKIKYIRQENSGVAAARNNGVQESIGNWVAFLDCDDWYLPFRLESQVKVINVWPSVDCVVGGFEYRDTNGKLINYSIDNNIELCGSIASRCNNNVALLESDYDKRLYIESQFSDTRAFSVTRELFKKSGGFPDGFQICEDVVFIIRCIAHSTMVGVMCESTAVYYVHNEGLIRSDVERSQVETINALKSMSNEVRELPIAIQNGWRVLVKKGYMDSFYYYLRMGKKVKSLKMLMKSFFFKPEFKDIRSLYSLVMQGKEK